jgi:hypothetical protein
MHVVIYWLVGTPLALVLWYFRAYYATVYDSAFSYMWFFLFFTVHLAFCIWAAIGELLSTLMTMTACCDGRSSLCWLC